jgi:hypothetical protein
MGSLSLSKVSKLGSHEGILAITGRGVRAVTDIVELPGDDNVRPGTKTKGVWEKMGG